MSESEDAVSEGAMSEDEWGGGSSSPEWVGAEEDDEDEFDGVAQANAEAVELLERFRGYASNMEMVSHMGFILDVDRRADSVLVRLGVLTDHIAPTSAMAWGVDRDRAIELTIDWSVKGPKLVGVQPDSMRIHCQVKKVVEAFLTGRANLEQWATEYSPHAFSGNELVRVVSYTWSRVQDLHMHCIICDEPHDDGISMINPTVCRRALCCFAWQLYAKYLPNFDLMGGVRGGQNVLLRLFFVIAALSDRAKAVLTPWPTVYGDDRSVLIGDKTDEEELRRVVDRMEQDETLCVGCGGGKCPKCALESWVITSNRSTILALPERQRNPYWKTEDQYLLLSNPPEMERKFQDLKAKHGSKFFYHGSPTDNWHSILRNGFFVASGSKLQLHGAAHGKGVYVADNMGTAAGYSRWIARGAAGGRKVPDNFVMSFIAVCEVIDDNSVVKDHGWCKTIPKPEYIVPRFILGWKGAAPKQGGGLSSTDPKVHEWCVATMASMF